MLFIFLRSFYFALFLRCIYLTTLLDFCQDFIRNFLFRND
uniref:Uncharacterized protein n=1 Tax=Bacteriophage sp. TaxID=38018 RepID=A0A8D9PES4_9VIRU|nr:MAG TPA: hypothetical protein [Bacteriophage sp.]